MNRADNYSLLLLAGGKSKRMGANKAELLYHGKTFVENLLDKAEQLGIEKVYLSGYPKAVRNAEVVPDVYQEVGPLGGIHAGLCRIETPYCLVLPIDVPQIPVEFLDDMLVYHEKNRTTREEKKLPLVLERQEFLEPLIAIYPAELSKAIEERIKGQVLSVFRMIKSWGYESYYGDVEEPRIANINTKEDYERLLK